YKAIKKIEEDIERFSLNTVVSDLMVCVNELTEAKCHKKEILEKLLIVLSPYAPHIAEELWSSLDHTDSILTASLPVVETKYLVESEKEYPVYINGITRTTMMLSLDADQASVEEMVLSNEVVQKWLEGKSPKKIIYVKGRMINVVI